MESKQADFGSKRSFLRLSAAAATLAGLRIVTEPMLAQAARRHFAVVSRKDGIFIDSNENPLGPSTAAREAVAGITPEGGRYRDDLSEELIKLFAEQQGLKTDSIRLFAGSTEPLHYTVLAYTSPKLSYVTADPGFEAGIYMSKISGARVVAVPLTKSYAHDVRAMVSAAPDAGVIYICNPNNPTGTLTPRSDIEWLVENKPKGAIVLLDEAYIHIAGAPMCSDLVAKDKDIVILRTFSKIYGMAGLRAGAAIGRPDLLQKMMPYSAGALPVTGMIGANASMKSKTVVPQRR